MIVDNAVGATVRADINSALLALVGNNSGATAPATTYAYMLWYDTANTILKQRNSTNTAWGGVDISPATTATQAVQKGQLDAGAGHIGELLTGTGSGVNLPTGTQTNIATVSLTAGDWIINSQCDITFSGNGTQAICGVNTVTANYGATPALLIFASGTIPEVAQTPFANLHLTSTATVYLVGRATFSTGTATGSGTLFARRISF
jgi:hypothetical protein